MPEVTLINPRRKTALTEDQVAARQDKAVRFARNVLGDDDLANELEELTPAEYAERKGLNFQNPNRKGVKTNMRHLNPERERSSDIADRLTAIEEKIDKITKGAKGKPESGGLFNPRRVRPNPRAERVEEELLTERDEILEALQGAQEALDDDRVDEAQEILDEILEDFDMEDGEEAETVGK
jgi:hypothetical protein